MSAIKLEAKTHALAGWKGYTTNLTGRPTAFVIDAYHQLWRIEKRPIYHRTRDSIEAHLSVAFAAMTVSSLQCLWCLTPVASLKESRFLMLAWEDDLELHALRKRGWTITAIANHAKLDR